MRAAGIYAAVCMVVLGLFINAKYRGLVAFDTNSFSGRSSSGGGGHGGGVYMGMHK